MTIVLLLLLLLLQVTGVNRRTWQETTAKMMDSAGFDSERPQ